jgi:hypothetical protein
MLLISSWIFYFLHKFLFLVQEIERFTKIKLNKYFYVDSSVKKVVQMADI